MTTSGSINFSVSRDDIIEEALMMVGAVPEGGAPTSDQLTDYSRTLNIMVKAWQTRGINLWAVQRLTLVLEQDKTTYTMGTDHITSSLTRTTLASAAASGASTFVVSSATGISGTYNIGIELDDGTMQWTTVSSIASTTVTPAATLTAAAAAGNRVYVYQTKYNALGVREVIQAFRRDEAQIDSSINIISREEYQSFGDKNTEGSSANIYFQPNLTSNVIYVYPVSSNETDTIELVCKRTLEDFDAAGDTPDFPQEAYEALVYGLAARISNHQQKPLSERQWLTGLAEKYLMEFEGWDVEQGVSTYISYREHK